MKSSWSPEQITGRLRMENNGITVLCHETIYRYLYSDYGIRNKYYQFLRRKRLWRLPRVSRKHRLQIPNRVGIHERPKEINDRSEFGHWEGDLMVFSKGISGNLITLRERKSRFMVAIKNETKQAKQTANKIINTLGSFKEKVKSLTFDNGTEFYDHERIAETLSLKTYFCDPYKSYQKGAVENANQLLREYFPREHSILNCPDKLIKCCLKKINNRPMKCLNYYTPTEVFQIQK